MMGISGSEYIQERIRVGRTRKSSLKVSKINLIYYR